MSQKAAESPHCGKELEGGHAVSVVDVLREEDAPTRRERLEDGDAGRHPRREGERRLAAVERRERRLEKVVHRMRLADVGVAAEGNTRLVPLEGRREVDGGGHPPGLVGGAACVYGDRFETHGSSPSGDAPDMEQSARDAPAPRRRARRPPPRSYRSPPRFASARNGREERRRRAEARARASRELPLATEDGDEGRRRPPAHPPRGREPRPDRRAPEEAREVRARAGADARAARADPRVGNVAPLAAGRRPLLRHGAVPDGALCPALPRAGGRVEGPRDAAHSRPGPSGTPPDGGARPRPAAGRRRRLHRPEEPTGGGDRGEDHRRTGGKGDRVHPGLVRAAQARLSRSPERPRPEEDLHEHEPGRARVMLEMETSDWRLWR